MQDPVRLSKLHAGADPGFDKGGSDKHPPKVVAPRP